MKRVLQDNTIKKATKVGMSTLVGVSGGKFPLINGGNCFSLITDDGDYSILNFGLENLEHLLETEQIAFPIDIIPVSDSKAVIVDGRIPKDYYWTRFCSTCCPWELLPLTQKVETLHRQATGQTTVRKISINGKETTIESHKIEAAKNPIKGKWTLEIEDDLVEFGDDANKTVYVYCPYIPTQKINEIQEP